MIPNGKEMDWNGHRLVFESEPSRCIGCFFADKNECPDCDEGAWVEDSPWYTGKPTEEGWYLLCYPRRNEVAEHYEVAEFDGRNFVFATGMHQVVVRTSPLSVAWMPITPYEEKENGHTN